MQWHLKSHHLSLCKQTWAYQTNTVRLWLLSLPGRPTLLQWGQPWGQQGHKALLCTLSNVVMKHGAASTPGCFILCRLRLVVGTLSSALVVHALCCSFPSVTHYCCAAWHCVSVHLLSELHGFSFWEGFCPTLLILIGLFAVYSIKLWKKVQLSHNKDKFYSNRAQQGAVAHLNGLITAARQWFAASSPGTQQNKNQRDGHLLLDPKGVCFEFWRAPVMQSDNQFLTNKQQKHKFTFFASHKTINDNC